MNAILPLLASTVLVALMAGVVRARHALRGTTLRVAWSTLLFALGALLAAWVVTALDTAPLPWREFLWYVTDVLMLVPPVAVLGARRPGAHAWTWFVLLPLVIVLLWPAVNAWTDDGPPRDLQLEGPHILGFAVVLTMGAGNYFGTRRTLSAILYAMAAALLASPFVDWSPLRPTSARAAATTLLVIALFRVLRTQPLARSTSALAAPLAHWESVWFAFRDAYGIVWAKRVMDRMNEAAREERWPLRLDLDGFVPVEPSPENALAAEQVPTHVEHWMRVLLRRFVDSSWLEGSSTPARSAPPPNE